MKDILAAMICIIIFALGFVSGTMFNRYDTVKTATEIIRTDRLTGSVEVASFNRNSKNRYNNFVPVGEGEQIAIDQ